MKDISSPVNLDFTRSVYNPDGRAAGGDLPEHQVTVAGGRLL
jgi:hypothetical protein